MSFNGRIERDGKKWPLVTTWASCVGLINITVSFSLRQMENNIRWCNISSEEVLESSLLHRSPTRPHCSGSWGILFCITALAGSGVLGAATLTLSGLYAHMYCKHTLQWVRASRVWLWLDEACGEIFTKHAEPICGCASVMEGSWLGVFVSVWAWYAVVREGTRGGGG